MLVAAEESGTLEGEVLNDLLLLCVELVTQLGHLCVEQFAQRVHVPQVAVCVYIYMLYI